MIAKLISGLRGSARSTPAPAMPARKRVYAVGDVHGRLDLLDMLLNDIAYDNRQRGECDTLIIFLGDLIDRGPHSAQVVDRLLALRGDLPTMRFLLGNHEEVFLNAVSGDLKALKFCTRIGGRETIMSYGISEHEYLTLDFPELLEELQARVPPAHIEFLSSFEDLILLGDYAFVHAGVRPGVALADQRVSDLRWIRDSFLNHRNEMEKVIVHGHSISEQVEEYHYRIGLDTGAFASGKLSAMGFEGAERWVLQAVTEQRNVNDLSASIE